VTFPLEAANEGFQDVKNWLSTSAPFETLKKIDKIAMVLVGFKNSGLI
jgi:hypothetical protein